MFYRCLLLFPFPFALFFLIPFMLFFSDPIFCCVNGPVHLFVVFFSVLACFFSACYRETFLLLLFIPLIVSDGFPCAFIVFLLDSAFVFFATWLYFHHILMSFLLSFSFQILISPFVLRHLY